MKKLLSFLLALTLSFSLATFALADNEGGAAQFDPRLTVKEKRDTIIVTVRDTAENAEILAEKQPTLTVACGYARAVVTDPNGMQIEATLKDGKITAAQKDWAKSYALKDTEGFKKFLELTGAAVPMGRSR